MIVLGHSSVHLEYNIPRWLSFIQGRTVGLYCLFAISGYLISASYERAKSNKEYICKRIVRLYPGLFGAFGLSLLCVLIFGMGVANQHYGIAQLFVLSIAQVTFFQFFTPSAVKSYATGNPNGSLWTISLEIQMYIIIMLIWKWMKKQKIVVWLLIIVGALMMNVVYPFTANLLPPIVHKLIGVSFIPYAFVFLIGMFVYAKKETVIPFLANNFWKVGGVYAFWCIVNSFIFRVQIGHYTDIITGILIPMVVFAGAYRFGKHKLKHDLSYGIYLYHMIIVNAFYVLGWKNNLFALVVVFIISIVLSFVSCVFVEEPVILKYRQHLKDDRR